MAEQNAADKRTNRTGRQRVIGNRHNRSRRVSLVMAMCFLGMSAALMGCQYSSRQFNTWQWKWPAWLAKKNPASGNPSLQNPSDSADVPVVSGNYFVVRILKSTGSDHDLRDGWSYLDEASPVGKDWQMLHRNGLRCGIGQYSDWPTVKEQLEKCGTKVQAEFQVALNTFSPINLLSDELRPERTLFYYDRNGRTHGRDFGASKMQFTMTTAGRMPGGRVRTIFVPRIFQRGTRLEHLVEKEGKKSLVEQELENFSISVDLGAEEFALIGPSKRDLPASLVGSQLFLGWEEGQQLSYFLLISPMKLEPAKK